MELNKEQEQITNPNNDLYEYVKRIVAAVKYKGEGDHEDVPRILKKFARGYEQKILELENRLKECENGYEGTLYLDRCKLHDAEEKIEKLTEENERLKLEYAGLEAGAKDVVSFVKADTVKQFAEKLKEAFRKYDRANWSVRAIIDEAAKEMVEGKNEK